MIISNYIFLYYLESKNAAPVEAKKKDKESSSEEEDSKDEDENVSLFNLHQNINKDIAFSKCLNGTFP